MDQKIADFQELAAVYAKRYGPYEWKRDVIGFDLMQIGPWLERVRATGNDLEFYDVMSEYVSRLNDAHDGYYLPSNYVATLNFSVDIYDGKLLVDTINRTRLPAAEFPFVIGYELVSIDGLDSLPQLEKLSRYAIAANSRSTRRMAAQLLTTRQQILIPQAANVAEISTVVFRRPDGNLETYRIPWARSGLLLTNVGRYATPFASGSMETEGDEVQPEDPGPPEYMTVLDRLQNMRISDRAVVGMGQLTPVFARGLPTNFVQRLGRLSTDPFFSGVFESGGYRIGFIRIPGFSPTDTNLAITSFRNEIAYFEANTDGLVVDVTRNPGGSLSYTNALVELVMPFNWQSIAVEVRATSDWVSAISRSLDQAVAARAPQEIIDLLAAIKREVVAANQRLRGKTPPIPLDDVLVERDPAMDDQGKVIAYSKPLIVLTDEMSASAAEIFASEIQDNARGPLVGWRTMGAGGSVSSYYAGSYSLGIASVTETLVVRKNNVVSVDYPAVPYIENVGVRPDVEIDYMTRDNFTQNGRLFVNGFIAAITQQIGRSK